MVVWLEKQASLWLTMYGKAASARSSRTVLVVVKVWPAYALECSISKQGQMK